VDAVVKRFLHDLKENALEVNGWTLMLPAYSISKQTLNAYTRVLAKKHPNICINCIHLGFVKTDMNWNTGIMNLEKGARGPVMLSLLPDGGPTGCYFDRTEVAEF
jgi:(+)-neomenthol dehydrogenase